MNVYELSKQVSASPTLIQQLKEDPEGTLKTVAAAAPLQSDVMIYRIVVISLGMVIVSAMAGAIMLSIYGKPIPETLTALGSGALGAMAGLLAPTPRQNA